MNTQSRACQNCATPFTWKATGPRQIYCSPSCRTKANEIKRVTVPYHDTCRRCGKELVAATGSRPRNYCSSTCRTMAWRSRHAVVEITCVQCGAVVRRHPNAVRPGQNFCSTTCHGKWMSEHQRGENHPNWKGTDIETLSRLIHAHPRFSVWAKKVIEAANGLCARCGKHADDAHHKREVEALLALILDPTNGEALCKSCHIKHHAPEVSYR